ncbi:MAG: MopE-related protein [Nitrospirota bacterium]
MKNKIIIPLLFAVLLIPQLFLPAAVTGQSYRFERMWPTLKQPWYFVGLSYIALDKKGNVFAADTWKNRIQKFSPDGVFITKWGTGGTGDGQFDSPYGIAVDSTGFVYVVDYGNHRIQKFSPDGMFITKWGTHGSGDGQFNGPYGIAVDGDGYIYVADEGNHRVQKFTSAGVFVTKWGGYGSDDGNFKCPASIAVDSEGLVYVTDYDNHRVQKFTADGAFIAKWGMHGTGNGEFDSPYGIAIDGSGFIYVTDYGNDRIQKFTSDGSFIKKWGGRGTGDGKFQNPYGIAADKDFVYVADYSNDRIQKFDFQGTFITKWGSIGGGNGEFFYPYGVAAGGGFIYVTDDGNHRVQKFSNTGVFITKWGSYGTGEGQFNCPAGVDVDDSGNVFVVDYGNNRIQKFGPDGTFITKWGSSGTEDGRFQTPYSLAVDSSGFIYVADTGNHRIQKFSPDGVFIRKWGTFGTGDGEFNSPHDVAVDGSGFVYVADDGNNRIQKFSPDGVFITKWGTFGAGDGEFSMPWGIASDSSGFIYVSEGGNRRTQKFTGSGEFVTKWGNDFGETDYFSFPSGLAVDDSGKVYIADVNDNRVLVFNQNYSGSNNRAIIVAAGGPFEGNHLWDATQMSANFAYQALSYQGYTKNDIYYMSPDSDLDIDSNGELDDVDSDVSIANLQYAVTEWAADADSLVLYIVDHGGNGTVRLNSSEMLAASDLDLWLDTLQNIIPGRTVVVYDACESGTFLSALTPPAGKERIVISSTSPGESAYFVSQGSVSFSYFFWTDIFDGNDIRHAFDTTVNALGQAISGQTPLLDDNGNGTGNDPDDGTLAQNIHIGNGTPVQGSVPVIGSVSPDQTVNGTASATLSAYNVTDSNGIARVWAVIIPPGFTMGPPDNAVHSLPYVDLLPVGGDQYEASFDGFNIEGTYQIAVYARDRIGNTSVPKLTTVTAGNPLRRKAIIVAGGDPADDNWNAVEKGALAAYNALTFQGYTDDEIYFLSPVAFSLGVDGLSVLSNLGYAVNTWAAENTWDVVLYMIGSGNEGTYGINNTETLLAQDLDSWLDDLQESIPGKVTIIYDASRAGSFLPLLIPPPGRERITVASTDINGPAYLLSAGDISFSRYFWIRILNGLNVRDAFISARQAMSFASGQKQYAVLDDNGNGTGNETGDGAIAKGYTIGVGIQLAGNDPLLGSVVADQVLNGTTSATIRVDSVTTTGAIEKVWAVITPPGHSEGLPESVTTLPELLLSKMEGSRYDGSYSDFSLFGLYHIAVYAMDVDGNISMVKETTVMQTDAPDMYEADDSYNESVIVTLNAPIPQQHTFHQAGDEDWIKFYGLSGITYEITVSNPGTANDAVVELYDTDGVTPLARVNNPGAGVPELLSWTVTSDGIYYVRVTHASPSVYGQDTEYDLKVYVPVMPPVFGLLAGITSDASSGARLSGVQVRTSYGLSDISRADGTYIIYHPSGTYNVTASQTGYETYQDTFTINGSETVTKYISMTLSCTDIDSDGYGSPGSDSCTYGSALDCNDGNGSIHPGTAEVCDGIDNDCDGLVDDYDPDITGQITWHPDNDVDGYGNGSISLRLCGQQAGFILDGSDCDDNDNNIYPGGPAVRIANTTPEYYSTLQDAYDISQDGSIIQSQATVFTQDISFNIDKAVFFEGGFDCGFSAQTGKTVISGNLVNSDGSVTLENFSLE